MEAVFQTGIDTEYGIWSLQSEGGRLEFSNVQHRKERGEPLIRPSRLSEFENLTVTVSSRESLIRSRHWYA